MLRKISIAVLATLCSLSSAAVTGAQTRVWHVKAVHPQGYLLDVKALDAQGGIHDVKALEMDGNLHVLDVKARFGDEWRPVKILASDDAFEPVKAIGKGGEIYDIKALTRDGGKLDVKGVARAGHIVHIKALGPEGMYGIKAISPEGLLHDVKGVRLGSGPVEATIDGVAVAAHVKALPQASGSSGDYVWHVKAVHPDGMLLDVKAFDAAGAIHDVKARERNGNLHLMDVKAFVNGEELPVKVLLDAAGAAPIKAIGADGTLYDVNALTPDGKRLEVRAVPASRNLFHVKAFAADGRPYGVKAISPRGCLYDVKGVKLKEEAREATIAGVAVAAHVKARPLVSLYKAGRARRARQARLREPAASGPPDLLEQLPSPGRGR